jgi:hypothetical protein
MQRVLQLRRQKQSWRRPSWQNEQRLQHAQQKQNEQRRRHEKQPWQQPWQQI